MPGRDGEAQALAGFRMLTGRNPLQVLAQPARLDVLGQLFQRGFGVHLPAHVVHAGLVGLAQDDAVVVMLVPGLEEHALLLVVARDFLQAKDVAIVLHGGLEFEHADLHVSGAQYTGECHSSLLAGLRGF